MALGTPEATIKFNKTRYQPIRFADQECVLASDHCIVTAEEINALGDVPQVEAVGLDTLAAMVSDEDLAEAQRNLAETFEAAEGVTLKSLRIRKGITQIQLAALVGKRQSYISQLENGSVKDPHNSLIRALSEALAADLKEVSDVFA